MVNYSNYLNLTGGTVTGDVTLDAHLTFETAKPTAAAGAGAGTSPPAPSVGNGANDNGGSLTFGTGTSPAAGVQVVVTFSKAFSGLTGNPHVVLTAGNAATQALGLYVTARSSTGFSIATVSAPAASQANTTYQVHFLVMG